MVYLDTSFVAPLVISEADSRAVEAVVMKIPAGQLTSSMWTIVELASLVSRKVSVGALSQSEGNAVRRELKRLIDESFEMLVPTSADFEEAAKYLEILKTGLRSGDALHLAIAGNHGARKILSLDKAFVEAGKRLNLAVSQGIRGRHE
ncbi:MAG TPA: type II toxin-antitoxin system VapC family toxin [Casimicrobiaceae bacterium]|jgi:hypothetical protein